MDPADRIYHVKLLQAVKATLIDPSSEWIGHKIFTGHDVPDINQTDFKNVEDWYVTNYGVTVTGTTYMPMVRYRKIVLGQRGGGSKAHDALAGYVLGIKYPDMMAKLVEKKGTRSSMSKEEITKNVTAKIPLVVNRNNFQYFKEKMRIGVTASEIEEPSKQSPTSGGDLTIQLIERIKKELRDVSKAGGAKYIDIIDDTFFERYVELDANKKDLFKWQFYLKSNDNHLLVRQIVANDLHITENSFREITYKGHDVREKYNEISKLLGTKTTNSLYLLEITSSDGGTGKTTYLWDQMFALRNSADVIYLKQMHPNSVDEIINHLKEHSNASRPLLIFLDDFAAEKNVGEIENIQAFAEKLYDLANRKVLFVLADRKARLESKRSEVMKFESYFGNQVYLLKYDYVIDKNKLFDKIYKILQRTVKLDLSEKHFSQAKANFVQSNSVSLIDDISDFVDQLKQAYSIDTDKFKFDWDWDDWDKYCRSDIKRYLKNLYFIVAFFYRYGIAVPEDYRSKMYLNIPDDEPFLLMDAVNSFTEDAAPILLENGKLCLRSEKKGDRFFKKLENGLVKQQRFLNHFISCVKTECDAYLFRNLTESPEFRRTELGKMISPEIETQIMEGFLAVANPQSEAYSKAALYLSFRYKKQRSSRASDILHGLLLAQPKNEYACHRLGLNYFSIGEYHSAEIYFKRCFDINPLSTYSLRSLLKLYSRTKNILGLHVVKRELLKLATLDVKYAVTFLDIIEDFDYVYFEELRHLEKLWRNYLPYRSKLSEIYFGKRNFFLAKKVLNDMLALVNPNDFRALSQLGSLYLRQSARTVYIEQQEEFLGEAEMHLKRSLSVNPFNLHSHVDLSRVYAAHDNLDEAFLELKKAMEIDFRNLPARNVFTETLFKDISLKNEDLVEEKLIHSQVAQSFILETLRMDRNAWRTIYFLAEINYKIISLLKRQPADFAVALNGNSFIKARNKDHVRLFNLTRYYLDRYLKVNSGKKINKSDKGIAGFLVRLLMEYGKITDAQLLLEKLTAEHPNYPDAAITLIKIYINQDRREQISRLLDSIRNSGLKSSEYIAFLKMLAKNKLYKEMVEFTSFKSLILSSPFDIIEVSVFLYECGKFDSSRALVKRYASDINDPNSELLKSIYDSRTSEVSVFTLVDALTIPRENTQRIRKALDNLSLTIGNQFVFSRTSVLRNKGILVLKAINSHSKQLLKHPHYESLKRIAQAYFKVFDRNKENLFYAINAYSDAFEVYNGDHELNKEWVNAYIEMGKYDVRGFRKAFLKCKQLQETFPDEPMYFYLAGKTLRKSGQFSNLFRAILEFQRAERIAKAFIRRFQQPYNRSGSEQIEKWLKRLSEYEFQIAECYREGLQNRKMKIEVGKMIFTRYEDSLNLLVESIELATGAQAAETLRLLNEKRIAVGDGVWQLYTLRQINKKGLLYALNMYLAAKRSGLQGQFFIGLQEKIANVRRALKK
jgi:hypothetical protein